MGLDFVWMMIQTFIALGFVCGLAYFLFRIVLPKLNVNFTGSSMVRIVDRVSLDAKKSLYVVEVADKWLLIAVSDTGVQLVSELDAASAQTAEVNLQKLQQEKSANLLGNNFAEKVLQLVNKKQGGK